MDKYEKLTLATILIAVLSSFIYFIAIIIGIIEPEFPYGIIISGWAVVLIPIIAHKRLEEKKKQGILKI